MVVATDAETTVDELLDAIEQGTLVLAGGPGGDDAPEGALDTLFTSADRLARDPDDRRRPRRADRACRQLEPNAPPYGVSVGAWAKAVDAASELADLIDDTDSTSSDIIGAAQTLRASSASTSDRHSDGLPNTILTCERPSATGRPTAAARGRERHRSPIAACVAGERQTECPTTACGRGTPCGRRYCADMLLGRARGVAHPPARADAAGGPRQPGAARRPGSRLRRALLGAVVAGHISGVHEDLVPDVHRLIDQIDRDVRVVQPRLRHRFQVDRHGLALSTHRLLGDGEEITFDFHTTGTGIAQVLAALYAVERLDLVHRHVIAPVLHKAMRWRGPVGPALIAHLAGTNSAALSTLADPRGPGRWTCSASRPARRHRPRRR